MKENQLLYLSKQEVASVGLTMREIIDTLTSAFRQKGEGRVEMPPKPTIHPGCFKKNRIPQLKPDGWMKGHSHQWSIMTPIGIERQLRKRISFAPMMFPSSGFIKISVTFNISRRFMQTWENWSLEKNREEKVKMSVSLLLIWASH